MDKKRTRFGLWVSVGFAVAALCTGSLASAAETSRHSAAEPTKTLKPAKAGKPAGSASATPPAKPEAPAPAVKPGDASPPAVRPADSTKVTVTQSSTLGEEARELTRPKSVLEAGVLGVTERDWKFGQYNGLRSSGAYGIGNLDLRGGGTYDSDDATRWRITGSNIGLETREFTGEYGSQGKYKIKLGYDEIPRFGQGTYDTPYLGAGGNELTLPSDWNAPSSPALNMRNLGSTRLGQFQNVDLKTKRQRVDGGFSYFLSPEWELKASARHEDKNGIKALGAPIIAAGSAFRSVILPEPIAQSTDQINASLNFTGEKAFGSLAYYVSIFHNDFNSVTFDNAYVSGSSTNPGIGRMSTMPDNQFHQFTLSGGYNFSPATKLVGSGGYGRNWQDQGFLPNSTLNGVLPLQSSLNGAVDFKNVNLKLTHRATSDLNLAASYKYDERENLTEVRTIQFPVADAGGPGTSERSNTPFSRRVQTGNLDANYSIVKGHWLKAGWEIQNIDRWCNSTWVSCVDTPTTLENIGKLDYRGTFFDRLNAKLGYAYSHRSAEDYNQDKAFLASYGAPQTPAQQSLYSQYLATGLPAWGPFLGYAPNAGVAYPFPAVFVNNNPAGGIVPDGSGGLDVGGLRRFNTASRNRQSLRSLLDYQVSDRLNVGVNGDWRHDDYNQSRFGLQSQRNWSINFDTNYAFSEDFSAHVFYTYQDVRSKTEGFMWANNAVATNTGVPYSPALNTVNGGCYTNVLAMQSNAKVDTCRGWLADMNDNIDTVGLGLKHKGLFGGKLDLTGDFLYSFARTLIDVNGGQYAQVAGASASDGPYYFIPAAALPEVKSQMYQIKLDAKYTFNKSSAAHLTYMYQHLISSDYIYTGMSTTGTPTGLMPTRERAPVYSVNVIGLSYIYNF